jgi:hypothetical protein
MSLHVLKNKKVSALRWYIFRNPMADQQVGDAFSLASLVHPLAGSQASAVFEVLANVPQELAAPILQATSAAKLGTALSEQAAKNIIWKVAHYLPSLIRSKTTPEGLSDKLKAFQQLSPDTPLAHVPNQRSTCAFCQGEKPLKARATVDKATIPNNLPGMSVQEHRFRVYSHAAGLQFARFGEMQCPECKLFFWAAGHSKRNKGYMDTFLTLCLLDQILRKLVLFAFQSTGATMPLKCSFCSSLVTPSTFAAVPCKAQLQCGRGNTKNPCSRSCSSERIAPC